MNRCPWCLINELETKYHDDEWGFPVYVDLRIGGRGCLITDFKQKYNMINGGVPFMTT